VEAGSAEGELASASDEAGEGSSGSGSRWPHESRVSAQPLRIPIAMHSQKLQNH
jgi:hypothetical protein